MSDLTQRSLRDSLFGGAFEMAELVGVADELQATVAMLCAQVSELPAEVLAGCQSADLLSQRISGMARFLAFVAVGAPRDIQIDMGAVAGKLPLGDQAARLCGAAVMRPNEAEAGELEVFDG